MYEWFDENYGYVPDETEISEWLVNKGYTLTDLNGFGRDFMLELFYMDEQYR